MCDTILKANGFDLKFKYLETIYENGNEIYDFSVFEVVMILDSNKLDFPEIDIIKKITGRTKIFHTDIRDMINKFTEHMNSIKKEENLDLESIILYPYDLGIQIIAFSGAYVNNEESYFTINCMLNIGKESSFYFGAESEISFNSVNNFLYSFNKLLEKVKRKVIN